MISFWVNQPGSLVGIQRYRERRGLAIADRFQVRLYEDLTAEVRCSTGPQIFTALDRISVDQRVAVAAIWDAHARVAPATARLNDPRKVLLRFPLLAALHERGVNSYRVHPATRVSDLRTFPVFVRGMNDHNGPLTGLLTSRWDVTLALGALCFRGYTLESLMIVEYCDTSRGDGLFRRYAAFKVGSRILACHMFTSEQWVLKSEQNTLNATRIREELDYMEANPHEDWIRGVFSIAGADYGRVDYGVLDGVPQVWEINLNPTLGRGGSGSRHASLAPELRKLREDAREAFHSRLRDAFVALDPEGDGSDVRVTIGEEQMRRIEAARARDLRRQQRLDRLRSVYDSDRWGRPIRAAYSTLFPRR